MHKAEVFEMHMGQDMTAILWFTRCLSTLALPTNMPAILTITGETKPNMQRSMAGVVSDVHEYSVLSL